MHTRRLHQPHNRRRDAVRRAAHHRVLGIGVAVEAADLGGVGGVVPSVARDPELDVAVLAVHLVPAWGPAERAISPNFNPDRPTRPTCIIDHSTTAVPKCSCVSTSIIFWYLCVC